MKNGISGKPIPAGLPFAKEITEACKPFDFPPLLAYAVRENETDSSTDPAIMQIGAIGDYMPDGSNAGHGPFQLTSSWPEHWDDPLANAVFAVAVFLQPAWTFWTQNEPAIQGDDLIRCIAASFNSGVGAAWAGHLAGNVDLSSTANYGVRALAQYHRLLSMSA